MNLPVLELIEKISLHCEEGTSDKVYHSQLVRVEGGFAVNIQHGKRMYDVEDEDKSKSALTLLSKPDSGATTYEKAKELFDEKVKEKLRRKRYQLYQTGHVINTQSSMYNPLAAPSSPSPVQAALIKKEAPALTGTGYVPQLLNPTTPGGCESMIVDPSFYASPKADGVRFMLGLVGGNVAASNRLAEGVPVPRHIEAALAELVEATDNSRGLCLDGELVGRTMYVFDLLELDGQPFSPRADRPHTPVPYFIRARQMQRLSRVYANWRKERAFNDEQAIKFLPIARTEAEKRKLYNEILRGSGEGLVFTHVQSILKPGRPNSGGDRWKMVFKIEGDFVVRTSDRRSFECFVYHDGQPVSVGFCASGVTDEIFRELLAAEQRKETKVAVIRYRHATGKITEGGKLFQSVFLHFRTDKRPEECLATQLQTANRNVLEELGTQAA